MFCEYLNTDFLPLVTINSKPIGAAMPDATNQYPFETKVLEGMSNFAYQLTGKTGLGNGFKAILNGYGCLLSFFGQSEYPDFRERDLGMDAYFLYDPFEEPEIQYISWSKVSKETLERILNIEFSAEDLQDSDGNQLNEFPTVHTVMF